MPGNRHVAPVLLAVLTVVAMVDVGIASARKGGHQGSPTPGRRATAHRAPRRTSPPTVTGTALLGHVLRASPGGWSGARRFSYDWRVCDVEGLRCKTILLTTSRDPARVCKRAGMEKHAAPCKARYVRSYLVTTGDLGHTVRVTVLASNAYGTSSATSRATRVIARTGTRAPTPAPTPAPSPRPPAGGTSAPFGLRVSGDHLVNSAGETVDLHGVNRSGTEYMCIRGDGIFDGGGPNSSGLTVSQTAADVAAMAAWHINIVRIPLNEDCWLGINGSGIANWSEDSGQDYIDAIVDYVDLLHQYGIYAELSLMWAAPGDQQATYQPDAPDEDHSPAMWTSMAQTFKNDPNVILAPWGETTVDWSCFENGCSNEATWGSDPGDGDGTCGSSCYYYTSAGMQQAVTDMRNAGYGGPIAIPCIHYANDCSDSNGSWLSSMPTDPDQQLLAEAHVYGGNPCASTSCFDSTMLPILQAGHPLIFGETGETWNYSDCPSISYIATFLQWAEQNGVGTEAWVWDTWGACDTGAMISNYNGTPEDPWAAYVEGNYLTAFPPDSELASP